MQPPEGLRPEPVGGLSQTQALPGWQCAPVLPVPRDWLLRPPGFCVGQWPSALLVGWGHGQRTGRLDPRGDLCPLPTLPGGWWTGCCQHGRLLTVPEKVNGRPAAVGVRWMSRRQGTARWPLSAGARSPGLLGLTLLWRNSSAPPGTLPSHRLPLPYHCGEVFIQQFPQTGGLETVCTELRVWWPGGPWWPGEPGSGVV